MQCVDIRWLHKYPDTTPLIPFNNNHYQYWLLSTDEQYMYYTYKANHWNLILLCLAVALFSWFEWYDIVFKSFSSDSSGADIVKTL